VRDVLLQAGAPITCLSDQMGHRDASVTREYAHYLPDAASRSRSSQRTATICKPGAPETNPAEVVSELVPEMVTLNFPSGNPDGELAELTPGAPMPRIVNRRGSVRITSASARAIRLLNIIVCRE
jgi:hypothetical protein